MTTEITNTAGLLVEKILNRNKMTIMEFSRKTGYSRVYVSFILHGKRPLSAKFWNDLRKVLEVTSEDIAEANSIILGKENSIFWELSEDERDLADMVIESLKGSSDAFRNGLKKYIEAKE